MLPHCLVVSWVHTTTVNGLNQKTGLPRKCGEAYSLFLIRSAMLGDCVEYRFVYSTKIVQSSNVRTDLKF